MRWTIGLVVIGACAAAWALGVPFEKIRAGLETFGSVLEQVPCRFNLLEYNGATLVLDYAHNISALESFLEVLEQFPHRKRSAVYAVPGDRSDDVIVSQAHSDGKRVWRGVKPHDLGRIDSRAGERQTRRRRAGVVHLPGVHRVVRHVCPLSHSAPSARCRAHHASTSAKR